MPVGVRLTEAFPGVSVQETESPLCPPKQLGCAALEGRMAFHARTAVRCSGREKPEMGVQVLDRTRLSTQIATWSVATGWQNPQT